MVSVAAGLARQELRPWVYSVATFHLRPSLRADSQRRMPARPPGRVRGERRRIRIWRHGEHPPCGMEDYGILLSLAGLQVHIPAFDADLPDVVDRLFMTQGPAYLRDWVSAKNRGNGRFPPMRPGQARCRKRRHNRGRRAAGRPTGSPAPIFPTAAGRTSGVCPNFPRANFQTNSSPISVEATRCAWLKSMSRREASGRC